MTFPAGSIALALLSVLFFPSDLLAGEDPGGQGNRARVLLSRLAARAALYESLLYKFECIEDISLRMYRKSGPTGENLEERFGKNARNWILVERVGKGPPREVRLRMNRQGGVRLDEKGQPAEATLAIEFAPVAKAFPHAQVAWFTAEKQKGLAFRFLDEGTNRKGGHRIVCPGPRDAAMEFLDRDPPRWRWTRCEGRASGQMCLDSETGEISALEFYGTKRGEGRCTWDLEHPFARIELEAREQTTGLRFPTQVETVVPYGRDFAVFVQRYLDYGFTNVRTEQKFGGMVLPEPP